MLENKNNGFRRKALICGISGQDGAFLAKLLLSLNYEVWGTSRDVQMNSFNGLKKLSIFHSVNLRSMSPDDFRSVLQVFSEVKPDEIYNLAGQSSVGLSFEQPIETMVSIATSTLNQLEAIRFLDKSIRFYNAGSGECFGDTGGLCADESTAFNPLSPYAVAKSASSWYVSVYRKSYGLFACTGILFNHESPLRPERFVTKKIVEAARRIASGSNEKLTLGNLSISRDWGWASDYVLAMWKMLNNETPEDFVIATGHTNTLQDFVDAVFQEAQLDWREYVISDPTLFRLSEATVSKGNPSKAASCINWYPTVCGLDVARSMYRENL